VSPPCDAIVLCAGLGTRLRPLTLERPKPAVPLLNRPLAGWTFALVRALGLTRVAINTHWLPDEMRAHAEAEARRCGLELLVSHEPEILGTGGGLRQARDRLGIGRDRPLLVLNGDVLFDVDLARVLATHRDTGARATMVLREMPAGAAYSPVEADAAGAIRRIARHGTPGHGPASLFTGVHVLSPEALEFLPAGACGVVETVYAPLLAAGDRISAAFEPGLWLDLGDPAGYLDAHLTLLDGDAPLGVLEAEGLLPRGPSGLDPASDVDRTALVERSAIGAGAVVGPGARVIDSVVWPGARVGAGEVVRRTIVTPRVRVPVA
jgi:mannose-1-phosphate guanylyltransferase